MKKVLSCLLAFVILCAVSFAQNNKTNNEIPYGSNKAVGNYALVNGIKMYYEIYGSGEPLVLIHGNGGSIADFSKQIPFFSQYYKVIIADSRGHGKSELNTDSLTYEQMSDDWSVLLDQLKIDSAYIVGWSDGGIEGLLLAINHPNHVKKLAAMGANLQPDSNAVHKWAISWLERMNKYIDKKITDKDTTNNWKVLRQYMNLLGQQPHISLDQLKTIKAPSLIMCGDRDVIKEEHTVLMFHNIKKAHLCIFPGATHMIPVEDPDTFNQAVYKFFKNPYTRPDTRNYF